MRIGRSGQCKLVEVDIVGLEPLEAPVKGLDKLRPALPPG